jgi:thioredoxin-like negative regulator of GroEL
MTIEAVNRQRATGARGGSDDAVRSVTGSEFDREVLHAPGPAVVEFMSYSCAHCRAIESPLRQVAQTVAPGVQIFRVNVALEPELAAAYAVHGTPTLLTFLNGTEVSRVEGPAPNVDSLTSAVTSPFAS